MEYTIHNQFKIEKLNSNNDVVETAVAYNVVLDKYWTNTTYPGYAYDPMSRIKLGDGSGTPSASDTTLFNEIGTYVISEKSTSFDSESMIYTYTGSILLDENTANGKRISEIGCAYSISSSNHQLFTHAMLTDMNGNPITILKTDTDKIRIYATIYVHVGIDDNFFRTLSTNGSTIAGVILGGAYGSVSVNLRGTVQGAIYGFSTAFVLRPDQTDPKKVKVNMTGELDLSLTQCNFSGGITHIMTSLGTLNAFDGDWLIGDRIINESVATGDGTKDTYSTKFYGCVNPKVYIDGVETKDVTIYDRHPIQLASLSGVFAGSAMITRVLADGRRGTSAYISDQYGWPKTSLAANGGIDMYENLLYDEGWLFDFKTFKDLQDAWKSNDLINWEACSGQDYVEAKYIKIKNLNTRYSEFNCVMISPLVGKNGALYNIKFGTPPPVGSVITIDYNPRCIAKDSNHRCKIQPNGFLELSPYTGE